MATIGLVACSKTKLSRPAPAQERYTSPLFRAASAYAERTYDRWLILSALHGLVRPCQVIAPYDQTLRTMSRQDRASWADRVGRGLRRDVGPDDVLYIHAGDLYRHWVMDWDACPLVVPLAGLGIGRQLAWYAVRRSIPGAPSPPPAE